MKTRRLIAGMLSFVAGLGLPGAVRAADAPLPPEPTAVKKRLFSDFHLLPKSAQSNPEIDMTVFSERTEYGRTLPDVGPQSPAYYLAQSQGYQAQGSTPMGLNPPSQEDIEKLVQSTLSQRGYLSAEGTSHPPSLGIFYYWGVHSAIDPNEVFESPELMHVRQRDILQRAKLVGGPSYVEKLQRQMTFGSTIADHTPKAEHLLYQVHNDLYYVVVSAYDYSRLTKGERQLVWRTTMTVNEQGVSIKETLPPLIVSAADYFGRDTNEPVALQRKIRRGGTVSLGPLIILGEAPVPGGTNPSPAPEPAKPKD
ncbi:MAG TPA: hypothetical protein VG734_00755 [Lacunisphaera sp.]|nr:hypothetical protein [Lacunisphaera sp.]